MAANKLTQKELDTLLRSGTKEAKKAVEFIQFMESNVAFDTYVAIKVTHLAWCMELTLDNPKIFAESKDNEKEFDKALKFVEKSNDIVARLESLKKQLTPDEQEKSDEKVKNSMQIFVSRPKVQANA